MHLFGLIVFVLAAQHLCQIVQQGRVYHDFKVWKNVMECASSPCPLLRAARKMAFSSISDTCGWYHWSSSGNIPYTSRSFSSSLLSNVHFKARIPYRLMAFGRFSGSSFFCKCSRCIKHCWISIVSDLDVKSLVAPGLRASLSKFWRTLVNALMITVWLGSYAFSLPSSARWYIFSASAILPWFL